MNPQSRTPGGLALLSALLSLAFTTGSRAAGGQPVTQAEAPCVAGHTVWSVQGIDERGAYTGQAELLPAPNGLAFIRTIDYDDHPESVAKDARQVSWVWQGQAVKSADGGLDLWLDLKRAGFVTRSGDLLRAPDDQTPATVRGHLSLQPPCVLTGGFSSPALALQANETWSLPTPSGEQPIFTTQVTETPTHAPIPADTLSSLFTWFASFHALPQVQPFVNRPEFNNPMHTVIRDRTDFAFYQQHPDRLRVVNKLIDPISLLETRARADAFRWTLAGKAEYYEQDTAAATLDPATGMLFEGLDATGKGYPSPDAALWTSAYMAGQFCRYQVTGDAGALPKIARSAESLLTLLEITGDPRTFARSLRQAEGHPNPPWYAATDRFPGLEWLAGGNNDMYKGVLFGLTTAQTALCGNAEYGALCARLQQDLIQAVYYLNAAQGSSYNRLGTLWLIAYNTGHPLAISEASKEWQRQAAHLASGSNVFYTNGITDWSGTHLAAVQYLMFFVLADRYPLPGIDSKPVLRQGVEAIYQQFARVPMGLWSILFTRLGAAPHPDAAEDALWRLRELPAPKTQLAIDHRVNADFVMSPFPSAPWKMDWTRNERTQSLRAYPLFEGSAYTVYDWKQSPFEYASNSEGIQFPGADYLFAYWLGRLTGVIAAND